MGDGAARACEPRSDPGCRSPDRHDSYAGRQGRAPRRPGSPPHRLGTRGLEAATEPRGLRPWGLLLAALVSWLPVASLAGPGGGPDPLLRRTVNQRVAEARRIAPALGVHVVEVGSGETVYTFQGDRTRILASNTKLVTTAAALDTLGPDFTFDTRVYVRGPAGNGYLVGDLAVVGGGDPNLSGRHHGGDPFAVFRRWAALLRDQGIRVIVGDLWLVDGRFRGPQVHPDWPTNQLDRWYEAPVSALSFSDNCVLVRVSPAPAVGSPAVIELEPSLPLFTVENRARTTHDRRRHRVVVARPAGSDTIEVRGSVYRGAAPVESWVTVADPVAYFAAGLRAALAQEGIELRGADRSSERLPEGPWRLLPVERSDLLTTLQVTNKRSQNFYAESLLKSLGAEVTEDGSWKGGVSAMERFLHQRIGVPQDGIRLADGSGMSRNNRMSAEQVTHLLRSMFLHRWGREFVRSLPFAGESGLGWETRLARPPYRGNVFAKTGTLAGVSTLSGYARGASGRVYAFSILMNEVREVWRARQAQDRIVMALVDRG